MLANYHTHTSRCRHATGTDEEYIQKAIAEGVKILGFSDNTRTNMLLLDGHVTNVGAAEFGSVFPGFTGKVLTIEGEFIQF